MNSIRLHEPMDGNPIEIRISITGAFNTETMKEFERATSQLPEATRRLILDMQDTTFLDQAAIGCLLGLRIVLTQNNIQLVIENCNSSIRSLFERTCIDHLFELRNSG